MRTSTQAQHLQIGDIVGSGETVIQVIIRSTSWPSHKCKIVLQKNDNVRHVLWGRYTMINVNRGDNTNG